MLGLACQLVLYMTTANTVTAQASTGLANLMAVAAPFVITVEAT
jgi:hypothetical protein